MAQMTAQDVLAFVKLLDAHGIGVCIDGGWGVDALLGEQTRCHEDLDVAVEHKDIPQIRALLEERGYQEVPRDDSWECNFVMGDGANHLIDLHSYTFNDAGNLTFGVAYPYDSLQGSGYIGGYPVKCIPPKWMVDFHTGYPLDENDYHDIKRLCQKFGFELPGEYREFLLKEKRMESKNICFTSIDQYIAAFPEEIQALLNEMRAAIKAAAPNAVEKISYQMPTFALKGNLVHFAAHKNHIGFYPTPSAIQAFKDELSVYESSKGAVQFPLDQPLPLDLIGRMVKFRVTENLKKAEAKSNKK